MSAQQQPDSPTIHRSYTEIKLSKCHAQTAEDRFGPRAQEAITAREEHHIFNHGPAANSLYWPASENANSESNPLAEIAYTVPSCARLRGNLAALSSVYNLYFSAHQDHIFVYRLRSAAAATLPKHPDAKIKCKRTKEGAGVRGHVDRQFGGRSLNHIITGPLGEDEILLACSDKGDVFAYYTKAIADQVFDRAQYRVNSKDCPRSFEPFFKANVGNSAWGLAIHKQSRLMAVSSNRWEVTVFAPELKEAPAIPNKRVDKMSRVEKRVRCRVENTRIIIGMPPESSNMPNICFLDDEQGYAEKVAGTDIEGHAWIADIWRPRTPIRRVLRNCTNAFSSEEFQGDHSKGWGLMAFQDHHFMKVRTLEEMVGIPRIADERLMEAVRTSVGEPRLDPEEISRRDVRRIRDRERDASHCLSKDLRCLLEFVPDNPCRPSESAHVEAPGQANYLPDDPQLQAFYLQNDFPTQPQMETFIAPLPTFGMVGNYTWPPVMPATLPPLGIPPNGQEPQPETQLDTLLQTPTQETQEGTGGVLALQEVQQQLHELNFEMGESDKSGDTIYYPHTGTTEAHVLETSKRKPARRNTLPCHDWNQFKDDDMAASYILLRTYEKDIEFTQATSMHVRNWELNPYYSNVLHCKNHWDVATSDLFFGTSRINMLFHIPELCIVVLGSPTGRVIVASLTKLERPRPDDTGVSLWHRGMRIEWILPRESDEEKHRPLLQARPLHGLAVGRIPEAGGDATSQRRWRIMLHYHNHLILSYEITRKEQTDKLCIF